MSALISRRAFAFGGAAFSISALAQKTALSTPPKDQPVTVRPDVGIATIRPELHGHFAEHLGSCIYGGLWVGKDSRIPNIDGYRKQAVEYLKAARHSGAALAGRLLRRRLPLARRHRPAGQAPQAREHPLGQLHRGQQLRHPRVHRPVPADRRRAVPGRQRRQRHARGAARLGRVLQLPVGQHAVRRARRQRLAATRSACATGAWATRTGAAAGSMTPEEYAAQYRRFATYIRAFGDTRPFLIACGPSGNDTDWSRRFMESMGARRGCPNGFAMHFYSGSRNTPPTKFTVETMQRAARPASRAWRQAIVQQRALLDSYDPERRIGLLVDEWGVWDRMVPEEEKRYGRLWQQITMRSAVAAALGLNVFHRQADKLVMCNIAQTVNVLHSMLLTDEDRCVRTPSLLRLRAAEAAPRQDRRARRDRRTLAARAFRYPPRGRATSWRSPSSTPSTMPPCTWTALWRAATAAAARARILHHAGLQRLQHLRRARPHCASRSPGGRGRLARHPGPAAARDRDRADPPGVNGRLIEPGFPF